MFSRALLALAALAALATPAWAEPQFPKLTGRVVDAANVIPDDVEARIDGKLATLETQSRRQLVVATIPDLQGYEISDYGYQLGRAWGIGSKEKNDGALLIVAPNERKLRIEVGYGLEPVLTDGMSSLIINQQIVPRLRAGDMPGGIEAGVDAIATQLALPPDEARKIAEAASKPQASGGFDPGLLFFAFIFVFFFLLPLLRRRGRRGRRYGSGLGPIVVFDALSHMGGGRSSGWGGGGGFGGFSGGGGSFGGGGASGSW